MSTSEGRIEASRLSPEERTNREERKASRGGGGGGRGGGRGRGDGPTQTTGGNLPTSHESCCQDFVFPPSLFTVFSPF